MEEKYPIGIQSFEEIRTGGYLYVDKTELVYSLVNRGKYYFLSRPRRFGKSLLLSTIKAYLEGRKELFKGLAIETLEKDWNYYPVILLTLAGYNPDRVNNLEEILSDNMRRLEEKYDTKCYSDNLSLRFGNIIRAAYKKTGRKVGILVDEYDAPMVAHLGETQKHEEVRNLLKSIYANLKDMDEYIKFGMLTGVSKFTKMTIFSGLNNLNDISLRQEFATICGITENELRSNFKAGISALAAALGCDREGALTELKSNYDGYHFTQNCPDLYNPFSLLNALENKMIEMYWFKTGTPTFLINVIRKSGKFLPRIFSSEVENSEISDIDSFNNSPVALMFQTGYLTIKGYDSFDRTYTLGIPNREVMEGLSKGLLTAYMDSDIDDTMSDLRKIRRAFMNGDPNRAMEIIKSFLAAIPYELANGKDEVYFENNLYLLFNLIGIRTYAEYHTSRGRIDLLLEMPKYIYIIELKLDGSAEMALAQIEERGYFEGFVKDNRKIVKIGVNFSRSARNIDSWKIS